MSQDINQELLQVDLVETPFPEPRIAFTIRGNETSEVVITELQNMTPLNGEVYRVFDSKDEVEQFFDEEGVPRGASVVLFDAIGGGHFTMATQSRASDASKIPNWSGGSEWAVLVHEKCNPENCAQQIRSDFFRQFEDRTSEGLFPWGSPKKRESGPMSIKLSGDIHNIMNNLNSGPDFKSIISNLELVAELPSESKISWIRVPDKPARVNEEQLGRVVLAMKEFEIVSGKLVKSDPEVQRTILSGVSLKEQELSELYLHPPGESFSIARPDLHYNGVGVFASENDEMPGGIAELLHLDLSYGLNEDRWKEFFQWLEQEGPILFVVSHNWSACYIEEFKFLVNYLNQQKIRAHMVITDNMDGVSVKERVFYNGEAIGTVWRQFPVFETELLLTELVRAASKGFVRMVPEFAHFGNKSWFSVFRSHEDFYRNLLRQRTGSMEIFDLLDEVLPVSHIIEGNESFPCSIRDIQINSLSELMGLPEELKNRLVLKVVGANALTARSYGVLMGHGIVQDTWKRWINERLSKKEAFIIQNRLDTSVLKIAVHNTKRKCPELFGCRLLLRPWAFDGKIVSASGCAVPSNTLRVHGRVDMAMIPVDFV